MIVSLTAGVGTGGTSIQPGPATPGPVYSDNWMIELTRQRRLSNISGLHGPRRDPHDPSHWTNRPEYRGIFVSRGNFR